MEPGQKFSFKNNSAFKFIIILGIVSLFADMTYEGARSITGSYLAVLGASAVAVGFVAGFGEFLGYGLRLLSGYWADKSGRYWFIAILGYFINLLAVPLIGLTTTWQLVAILIILERVGKAIRSPAKDAMLSHAGHQVGIGLGFGIHEALDQIGAMLGPLIVALVLYYKEGYQLAFIVLLIPALCSLSTIFLARHQYPHPRDLEIKIPNLKIESNITLFWIYLMAAACVAAGFIDFPLMAYHFQDQHIFSPVLIPLAYAVAMGMDALFSPILGYCYDRFGFITLIMVTCLSSLFSPLVFLTHQVIFIYLGVVLWAIGIGSQASIMRAVVGKITPVDKRASFYGVFNMGFGLAWFLGSMALGWMYDHSIVGMVILSLSLQFLALPFLLIAFFKGRYV